MKNKITIVMALFLALSCYCQSTPSARISLDIGYGYRTGNVSDTASSEFEDYIEELRSGLQIDTHIGFFVNPYWGLGAVYNRFQSSNSINLEATFFDEVLVITTSNDISIDFIAPEFFYHHISANQKHNIVGSLSIGYLKYINKVNINDFFTESKGGTIGFGFGAMYDYSITPNFAIGAGINFITGSISKFDVTLLGETQEVELPDDLQENLSKIGISAGLRLYL